MKVFISYARTDSDFTLRVAADIRAAGVDLWVDQLDIPKGAIWDRETERALTACSQLLVILSPAAVASDNVMDEAYFGLDEGKSVLPVLYQACTTPYRLRRLQYIDFTGDYTTALSILVQALLVNPAVRADAVGPVTEPISGDELVSRLASYICDEFKRKQGIDLRHDRLAVSRIKEAAATAKAQLTFIDQTEISLAFITADNTGPKHLLVKLTREMLESLSKRDGTEGPGRPRS